MARTRGLDPVRIGIAVLLACLACGCLAAQRPAQPDDPPAPGAGALSGAAGQPWAFSPPTAVNPAGEGFEPSLRSGPDGSLYAAAARGFFAGQDGSLASPVWASRDGGATWKPLESPAGLRDRVKTEEGDLAVDAQGTVYFIDTYAADNVLTAWAADGTWKSTRPLQGTLALDDRPWLAAQGKGILYAVGNSAATVPSPESPLDLGQSSRIALYRSEDGGTTWSLGHTFPDAWYCHVAASPGDDVSLAVACSAPPSGPDPSKTNLPPGPGATLWWSHDRGSTWQGRTFPPVGDSGILGYPSVSFDAQGRWCAAWGESKGSSDRVRVACLNGSTWGNITLGPEGRICEPWLALAPEGGAAVAYYARNGSRPWAMRARLTANAFANASWQETVLDAQAHQGPAAPPDFFQAAFDPRGALHVAYSRDPSLASVPSVKPDHTQVAHVGQAGGPTLARSP
jgi:hypothetical protein